MMDSYAGKRICGVEDRLGAVGQNCRWQFHDLKYTITGTLPGIGQDAIASAIVPMLSHVSTACNLRFARTTEASQAHIVLTFGQIDGPMGTLAWSELPCGNVRQVTQRYDVGESFVIAANPPRNRISFPLVFLHELLHALGVPHLEGGTAVMNPTYNPDVRELQDLDRAALVARYGPPQSVPPPPPVPAPAPNDLRELQAWLVDGHGRLFVRVNGVLYGQ